jgi:hypothetical protein
MRFLSYQDQAIVNQALELGLQDGAPPPAYWSPHLCTALSFLLAVPSMGFSLVLVPILWVAQYDRTKHRILCMQKLLESQPNPADELRVVPRGEPTDDELAEPSYSLES